MSSHRITDCKLSQRKVSILTSEKESSSYPWTGNGSTGGGWYLKVPPGASRKPAVWDWGGWSGAISFCRYGGAWPVRTLQVRRRSWDSVLDLTASTVLWPLSLQVSKDQLEVLTESFRNPDSQQSSEKQSLEDLWASFWVSLIWSLQCCSPEERCCWRLVELHDEAPAGTENIVKNLESVD